MGTRNPVAKIRGKVEPGRRVLYTIPGGPPVEAIEAFGGDAGAAITAGLTLLALSLRGGVSVAMPQPSQPVQAEVAVSTTNAMDAVLSQDLWGEPNS